MLTELAGKFGMNMEDRFLAITTISFDISVLEIFMPLMHGASVHLTTKEESFDPIWLKITLIRIPSGSFRVLRLLLRYSFLQDGREITSWYFFVEAKQCA
ncbi:MAG: hypothetical protein IPP46_16765 [Bacteroidetes bacterium]|nr:hypothetical protein [Bacteroidota bacterium]